MATSSEHGVTPKTYFVIFGSLMVLTVTTVFVSSLELGMLHTPVALSIAVLKATLVVLFFMHVLHSPKLTVIVVLGSVFWLTIMLMLTLSDYLTRGGMGH